jgi:hypothetical protein
MFPTADAVAWPVPAFIGANVNFDGSNSYDGLCGSDAIVLWGWDWDYDSVIDQFGETVTHSWDTKGTYPVQLKVKDDEESYAMSMQPLQIDVFAGWARTWGGPNIDVCTAVCTDSSGNVYAAGSFAGTVDFDPGLEEFWLTAEGAESSFLCKYDPSGNFLWAVCWGSSEINNEAQGVAAYGDNVYVTGYFRGTIDLDPSPDSSSIWTSQGNTDIFASKFSSSGDFQWGVAFGGIGWEVGRGIAVGNAEEFIEVAGRYESTADFDPSGSVDSHTSNGSFDCFLTRLTPSGAYVWTQTWGGTAQDQANAVAIDKINNTYVTGSFQSAVNFDPSSATDEKTSVGGSDVFLTRRDSSGAYSWTLTWGGSGADVGNALAGGKLYGEAWVTGSFSGIADFDPTAGVDNRTSNEYSDIFLCGFNQSGTRYFTATWGGTSYDDGLAVTYRTDDTVYVTGDFRDTVDFDPGPGTQTFTANGVTDAFLSAYTWNGEYQWAQAWGGTGNDIGLGISCLDVLPKPIVVGGLFMNTVDFNPGPGVDEHTASGNHEDAFISRFPSDGQW